MVSSEDAADWYFYGRSTRNLAVGRLEIKETCSPPYLHNSNDGVEMQSSEDGIVRYFVLAESRRP